MQQPSLEEIEYWLAKEFNYRQNIVVPNVSWGLRLHECDLLVLRPSGYAAEIEIKRSLADLKADNKKHHAHISKMVRELWFAIPAEILEKALPFVPERAGIITYKETEFLFETWRGNNKVRTTQTRIFRKRVRKPKVNMNARKLTDKERQKLLELAHMRIWTMKRQMARANKQS